MAAEPPHDPPPPPPPRPSSAGDTRQLATGGALIRWFARFLDGLLVFIPASLLLQVLGISPPVVPLGGMDAWLWSAVTGALWFGYYVVFETLTGSTIGKKVLGLNVVGPDGGLPDAASASKRNLWMLFGLVPIIGGLAQFIAVIVIGVTIASSSTDRGKHDEIAETMVVKNR